jgi:hypothetical protein
VVLQGVGPRPTAGEDDDSTPHEGKVMAAMIIRDHGRHARHGPIIVLVVIREFMVVMVLVVV